MRFPLICRVIACGLCFGAAFPLEAQEEMSGGAKAERSGYQAIKVESLPRDENGQLTPEVWEIIAAEATASPNSNEARAFAERGKVQEYFQTVAGWKPPEVVVTPGKRLNLSEVPKTPRFPLTGKVWPSKPGEASVCLWEDDKLAAMSLGVDDNCAQDLPFWKTLSEKHGGLKITWNLITYNIDGGADRGRVASAGTWQAWRQMLDEGFRVASHSATHLRGPVPADGWPGPEWEVAQSKLDLEQNLPGQKIRLFVYPGAGVRVFAIPRDPATGQSAWRPLVAKYYSAARSGGGEAINPANMIDYLAIKATTGAVPDLLGSDNPRMQAQNLNKLFDPDPSNKNYRGWANIFIHFINNGKTWDTDKFTIAYDKVLAFYNEHRDDLWTGFMEDIALYGQVRDTATLVTDESSNAKIVYTLTSEMDPEIFDYPVTVKVRLPDAWKNASGSQNGAEVPVQVIEHEGAPYALVKTLADRGPVTLLPN
jgi:peptidoglycan/xylan/chitin deacetylase (PgdA/CDA1 family)